MQTLVPADKAFLPFCRPYAFDDAQFCSGHDAVYFVREMDKSDEAFDKQTRFNFSQQQSTAKKQTAAAQRTSWSAVLDLDHNVGAHAILATDFCDLVLLHYGGHDARHGGR